MGTKLFAGLVPRWVGRGLMLGFIAVSLTGCIEIFQYVSRSDDGRTQTTLSLRIQKAIIELGYSFSDEGSPNYEEEFSFTEDEIASEYPEWIDMTFNTINTDLEYGFEINLGIDEGGEHQSEALPFIPRTADGVTVIAFGVSDDSNAEDNFAMAFLASSKYRLIVSKSYLPRVNDAWYEAGGDRVPVEFNEFDDVFYVEFPILYILMGGDDGALYLAH